jgi:hypothetical protein
VTNHFLIGKTTDGFRPTANLVGSVFCQAATCKIDLQPRTMLPLAPSFGSLPG